MTRHKSIACFALLILLLRFFESSLIFVLFSDMRFDDSFLKNFAIHFAMTSFMSIPMFILAWIVIENGNGFFSKIINRSIHDFIVRHLDDFPFIYIVYICVFGLLNAVFVLLNLTSEPMFFIAFYLDFFDLYNIFLFVVLSVSLLFLFDRPMQKFVRLFVPDRIDKLL